MHTYTVELVLKDHPISHKNVWSVKTGDLYSDRFKLFWNVCPDDKNMWSFKTGGLSWRWFLKTGFTVVVVANIFGLIREGGLWWEWPLREEVLYMHVFYTCLFSCVTRDCLTDYVQYNENAVLVCPFDNGDYKCSAVLQDREVRAVSCNVWAKGV